MNLFTYGTLRPKDSLAIELSGYKMFDLGWFPGVIKSDDPQDTIWGSVVPIKDDDHLAALDAYEGCCGNTPNCFYHRINVNHSDDDPLYLYVFNESVENSPRVHSGDWLDYKEHAQGVNAHLMEQSDVGD